MQISSVAPDKNTDNNPDNYVPHLTFKWLWHFIMLYRHVAIGAVLCGVVAGITVSVNAYLIGIIIDHLRVQVNLSEIAGYIGLLIGLTCLSALAFYGQRQMSGYVSVAVHAEVSQVLFDHLLTLEQGFYQRYPTGDLISRVYSDVDLIWRLLALGLTRIGSAILTLIMAVGLLLTINLPLTLTVVVILGISAAVQMRVGKLLAPVFEQVQAGEGNMTALLQDTFSGIQTIKTFGREAAMARLYRERNVEYRRRWLYFTRRNEPIGMVPNMISEATAALVVFFGGVLVVNGAITLGNFTQFLLYLGLITQALLQLGTIYQRYQQVRGALTRLEPLLQPPMISDAPDARPLDEPRGEITFENVGVQIDGQWRLRNVNLHIPAGTVLAIVGATGSGKTLLVSLLARILDPIEGRILLDGIDIRSITLRDLRRAVVYVPQSTFLFSLPLHQNVRMGVVDADDEKLHEALHIARVSNDLPQLPHGIDTLVGERGVLLSGGQKQRVAIARALIRDPAILVLDDALSSVDVQTAADILGSLRGVLKTRTSIVIAHRMATVKDADRVVVLSEGRLVEEGTHQALIEKNGVYARMVERELTDGTEDEFADE